MIGTRIATLTRASIAFAFLTGVGTSTARAQSAFWDPVKTAGGSWGGTSNWLGGTIPSGAGNAAGFVLNFDAGAIVTLDGDRVIGTILSTSVNPWSIDAGIAGTLTVANIVVTGGTLTMITPLLGVNFVKDGSGALILSNSSSAFSGTININSGKVSLVGSGNYSSGSNVVQLAAGAVLDVTQLTGGFQFSGDLTSRLAVQDGEVLTGVGEEQGGVKVKSGGTVYPGINGVGTLTVKGRGIFETGSNWRVKLGTADAGDVNLSNRLDFGDLLDFNNDLTLEDGMNIPIDGNGLTFTAGQTYDYLISLGADEFEIGAVNFQPFNFAQPGFASPNYFSLIAIGNSLTLRFMPVPEPATMLLVGIAGGAWLTARRRKSAG